MRIQNDVLSNILGAASDIAIASPFVPNNALILANDTLQSVAEKTQGQIDNFSSGVTNPIGTLIQTAGTTAPPGCLICDGTAYDRTTYADLFAVIGITHGQGNGSTTFNVPDYRGRFLRMVAGAATTDPDKLTRTAMATGGNTGNNVGSVQSYQVQSHSHTIPRGVNVFSGVSVAKSDATSADTIASGSTGGNETRPINAYVNIAIVAFNQTATLGHFPTSPLTTTANKLAAFGDTSGAALVESTAGEFSSYTPIFTATTTNPTLATTKLLTAPFSVVGKTMRLSVRYYHTSATGAAAGSGSYLVSIPPGYTIDTSFAVPPTSLTTAGDQALNGVRLGGGMITSAGTARNCTVCAASSTTLILTYITAANALDILGSANFSFTGAPYGINFDVVIPLL
jgi:microcystin-dependent protein